MLLPLTARSAVLHAVIRLRSNTTHGTHMYVDGVDSTNANPTGAHAAGRTTTNPSLVYPFRSSSGSSSSSSASTSSTSSTSTVWALCSTGVHATRAGGALTHCTGQRDSNSGRSPYLVHAHPHSHHAQTYQFPLFNHRERRLAQRTRGGDGSPPRDAVETKVSVAARARPRQLPHMGCRAHCSVLAGSARKDSSGGRHGPGHRGSQGLATDDTRKV